MTKYLLIVFLFNFLSLLVHTNPNVAYTKLKGKPSCAYSAEIIVGGTTFELLVDTGSSNLAVPSPSCTCQVPQGATYSGSYDTNQGVSVKYGSGSWSGYVATDSFQLQESTNNSEIPDFQFAVITQQSNFYTAGCGNDGIMGLGYTPIDTDSLPIPIQSESMINGMPYGFALYMCGNTSQTTTYKNGNMWWGGYDSTYVATGAEMKMISIIHQTYYVVLWSGIKVGNVPVSFSTPLTNADTIIDTGTTQIIFASQQNAIAFVQAIQNSGIVTPTPTGEDGYNFWQGKVALKGYEVDESIQITFQFLSENGDTVDVAIPISNLFPSSGGTLAFEYEMIYYGSTINIIGIAFQEGQVVFFDRSSNQIGFALGNSVKCLQTGSAKNINVFAGPYQNASTISLSTLVVVFIAMAHVLLFKNS